MESRYEARAEDRRHRARSRSRSPRADRDRRTRRSTPDARTDDRRRRATRSRSRSPRADRDRGTTRRRERRSERPRSDERRLRSPQAPTRTATDPRAVKKDESLPFGARRLGKADLGAFRPLLAYYLSIQKQRDMAGMGEREVRGRWKSFVRKWNEGTLAEGWYDPSIWETAVRQARDAAEGVEGEEEGYVSEREDSLPRRRGPSETRVERADYTRDDDDRDRREEDDEDEDDDDDDDDDEIGAVLPPTRRAGAAGIRHTVAAPHTNDLRLRDELLREESAREVEDRVAAIREARKADRRDQKERLEELVPRADPGSRERKLEKKREVNDKMAGFREKSPGGEVDEGTLMGGGEDSLAEMKKREEAQAKKKTERESRREEMWRAKLEEREERVQEYRDREKETVEMLKELARSAGRNAI